MSEQSEKKATDVDVLSQSPVPLPSEGGIPTIATPSSMSEKLNSEAFSLAYIRAVAARAGVNIYRPEWDFGVDLAFTRVDPYQPLAKKRGRRHRDSHTLPIPFQVKSSKNWKMCDDTIVYDLEAKNYDDLVNSSVCLLLLMCLPPTIDEWMHQDEQCLQLHHGCYYWQPSEEDEMTPNEETKRITIPRKQLFTAEALLRLLSERQRGIRL